MNELILLLWLKGPMQSWGTRSRWDVRDTGLEPTKSGIIGLLGCAAGLTRNDPELEKLDHVLLFGVRCDLPGIISTDFHTVKGYHRTADGKYKHSNGTAASLETVMEHGENTVVSLRDYLHDASFLVGLAVKPEYQEHNVDLLVRLSEQLQHPRWPLYLGRKACVPTRPVFHRLTDEYKDLETALISEPWDAPRSLRQLEVLRRTGQTEKLVAWIEHADGEFERQDAMRVNQLRFYDFRRCKRIEVDTVKLPKSAL
ncbi:MAG: type I-E CRISPR-associated protein Cas5/CasD [Dehalococcoidales bacterium]|nr:type I-E CRISPR-associated protein Cas5/CasD [Dehalococcoidales bacterium]